jgi:hypothetical protein
MNTPRSFLERVSRRWENLKQMNHLKESRPVPATPSAEENGSLNILRSASNLAAPEHVTLAVATSNRAGHVGYQEAKRFHTPGLLALMLACMGAVNAVAEISAPAITEAQVLRDWLRQDEVRLAKAVTTVTPASDGAGGVDGRKTGEWGFHTDYEPNPWWQVDLKEVTGLDRVVIWNRCDATAGRNARIRVFGSQDGLEFRLLHEHDGSLFYGYSDNRPLTVPLGGARARFLRLGLSGTNYFHLDEVEVFENASNRNVALGKPATQSSISQWSVAHQVSGLETPPAYPIDLVIERGLKLAASQRRLGAPVDPAEATLRQVKQRAAALGPASGESRDLYLQARRAVREMALANPLLTFDSVLFVKRAPGMFPHMSDQHYGWWSRGGGGVYVLEGIKSDSPRLRCLTSDMSEGSFMGPDLSFDGKKLLFAYCRFYPGLADERNKADKANVPENAFYHIYEMNVDGSGRRQLSHGKYDDFDARYLPGGDLVFVSTRKGTAIQCSQWFSDSTRKADFPDSYVRCGGDNYRPVPVFTLHGMNPDGGNLRPLSAFENFEWSPSIANDGRLLYTRWDYIDRFNGHFFSLWSANQDGTNPQLLYGNYTVKPQVKIEARAIPGSSKVAFIASAHHSIYGGSLCLMDRNTGTEGADPLTRVTPEVPFPETEGAVPHYYANPWPLSEEYFLVSWSDQKLPPHCRATEAQNPRNATGLYLLDAFGNLELLYRDAALSSASPVPLRARVRPPVQATIAAQEATQEGRVLLQDVYRGLEGVPHGSVKQLRLVAVPPKVQPQMNQPSLGVSSEDPGKFVLGTVPVEPDGSAWFRVPSGVPVFFQALDAQGTAVQTMRTLTYVMPGQTLSCVGCHEHRESAPPVGAPLQATARAASRITPGPPGSWPLRFEQLVQPVLDKLCIECHRAGAEDVKAARLDLGPGAAHAALLEFAGGDLKKRAFERDRSLPGEGTAAQSRLWQLLSQPGGHRGVELDAQSRSRLLTWMDTYAQRTGHFSEQQAGQIAEFRQACAPLLEEVVAPPPGSR